MKVKWVSTSENPADLLSRGCSLELVQDELLWKRGPDWLVQESEWIADPETSCVSVNEIVSELPQYEVPQSNPAPLTCEVSALTTTPQGHIVR